MNHPRRSVCCYRRTASALLVPIAAVSAMAAPPGTSAGTDGERRAILAMRGEYAVDFGFEPTVLLADGYARMKPQRSDGRPIIVATFDQAARAGRGEAVPRPKCSRCSSAGSVRRRRPLARARRDERH